jgi:hypothetical protein
MTSLEFVVLFLGIGREAMYWCVVTAAIFIVVIYMSALVIRIWEIVTR